MKDEYKTKAKLLDELKLLKAKYEQNELELRTQKSLDQVRSTVYDMQETDDIRGVSASLFESLSNLGMNFEDCSIQIIDKNSGGFGISWRSFYEGQYRYHQMESDRVPPAPGILFHKSAVYEAWQNKQIIYRRDLNEEDKYNEREVLLKSYEKEIRSVMDAPFSHGTIAVNSTMPDAFSEKDIETLKLFTKALSEAYNRILDIHEIKISERSYRNIVEHSRVMIFRLDMAGNYFFISPTVEKLTGYSPEDFYADRNVWNRIVLPEDMNKAIGGFLKGILGEPSVDVEYRIRDKAGSILWVSQNTFPVKDSFGRILSIEETIWDITTRKQAEETIHIQRDLGLSLSMTESLEEILKLCVEAAINASGMDCGSIYLVDKKTGELKLAFYEGLSPDFIQKILCFDANSSNTHLIMDFNPIYTEYKALSMLSDEVKLQESLRAIAIIPILHEGKVIGYLNIASHTLNDIPITSRNILEVMASQMGSVIARVQVEDSLKESEEKYRILVENAGQAVVVAQDGMLKFINPKTIEILGYSEKEITSRPFLEFIHPEDKSMIARRYQKRLKDEYVPDAYHFRIIDRDGNIKWMEINAVLITWEGQPATLNFMSDITKLKLMTEELLKIQKLESIGILAGGIAHDFNNILTGIMGNIALARLHKDPDKSSERLTEAEKAAFRAKNLTQQLLTFAKGGAPIRKTISIAKLLRESALFMLSGSNARCEFSISDDLWPVAVDEGQLNQVLNNLIINADQAMLDGGIIGVNAENIILGEGNAIALNAGKYVKISIIDEGIGIPEENIAKIFDPYFTTKKKGTGLGLTSAYSIVKNHDGYITAESPPGKGTTFHVYLPASSEKISIEPGKNENRLANVSGKILVMDDEEIIRELIGDLLAKIGYEVALAKDGTEAIQLYENAKNLGKPFGALIMDLTIPGGMGGKETIQKLMEMDRDGVKAIVSSGYSSDPIMSDYKKYGFKGVIAKPYKISELSELLHEILAL